jgi:hypothetical protein
MMLGLPAQSAFAVNLRTFNVANSSTKIFWFMVVVGSLKVAVLAAVSLWPRLKVFKTRLVFAVKE